MSSLIMQMYDNEDCGKETELIERTQEDIDMAREHLSAFLATLTKEQAKLYDFVKVDDARLHIYREQTAYRRGFRSGAKMMMEILTKEE